MSQPSGQPNSPRCSTGGPALGLQFQIRLEPRLSALFGNLKALLQRPPEDFWLSTAPFWPDVFVERSVPWSSLVESALSHGLMIAAIWGLSHAWLIHPQVTLRPVFQPSQIVYYTTSEYLPAIQEPSPRARAAHKAEPAYAPQEIISVPPEADNHTQTIITTPDVKLAQEMHLPNLVAWTPNPGPVPVPGSLNSKLTLPTISTPVIPPPPEVARANNRSAPLPQPSAIPPPPEVARTGDRASLALAAPSVIAPAPDVADAANHASPALPQPRAVAPAPETASALANLHGPGAPQPAVVPPPARTALVTHPLGAMNVADLQPGVAAPRLPVPAQQIAMATEVGGGVGGKSGHSGATGQAGSGAVARAASAPDIQPVAFGRPVGQMIALGVAPSAVSGPIEMPQGNRHGLFAAGPSGHPGASGTPAANSGGTAEAGTGKANSSRDKLAGITIAPGLSPPANTGAPVVAAAPARNLLAMLSVPNSMRSLPPRVHEDLPGIVPSEIERQVFGNKKFYSVTLNMPNLNSRSGSWVIRFAELNNDSPQGDLTAPVVVEKVDPAYPGILMREHITGTVTLYAVIGADGSVGEVRVLRGVDNRLDAAARDALRRCHFRPATKNGTAVALEAVIRIPFEVQRIPY